MSYHAEFSTKWDSLASCAPVVYRRNWRVANPPNPEGTPSNLPHGTGR
jgi:hypothetical protein